MNQNLNILSTSSEVDSTGVRKLTTMECTRVTGIPLLSLLYQGSETQNGESTMRMSLVNLNEVSEAIRQQSYLV